MPPFFNEQTVRLIESKLFFGFPGRITDLVTVISANALAVTARIAATIAIVSSVATITIAPVIVSTFSGQRTIVADILILMKYTPNSSSIRSLPGFPSSVCRCVNHQDDINRIEY